MIKYIDKKVFLNIIFFVGVIYFTLHYKEKIDRFDTNYMYLTQTGYELDLQNNQLINILKASIINLRFNNDYIVQQLQKIEQNIDTILKNSSKYDNYKKSFVFIQQYKQEMNKLQEQIYQFMRYNAKINNSLLYLEDKMKNLDNFDKKFRDNLLRISTDFINLKHDFGNKNGIDPKLYRFFDNYETDNMECQLTITHIKLLYSQIPKFKQSFNAINNSLAFTNIKEFKSSINKEGTVVQKSLQQQFWVFIIIFIASGILFIFLTIQSKKYSENILKLTRQNEKNLRYDRLTNTFSRAVFNEDEKENKILRSILIDIKQFNKINSMIGYDGGDYVLQQLALVLKKFGKVYRVGADKFIVNINKEQDHISNALDIHGAIQNLEITYKGFTIPLNIDIGITDTKPLIKTAELAISSNKNNNEVINIYDPSMDDSQSAKQNIEMLKRVNEALKNDHIRPFFQPIVSLETKKTVKYESLVRLMDQEKPLSPYFFLDITKGSSTYQSITKLILKKSMELIKKENIDVSINISFEDIEDQNTINYINFFLMKYKDLAHFITFEILESEHISNFQIVENFIKMVKKYGCLIAIDDFGSGYSNFEYLFNLEPDIVKIDGSLIKDIHINKKSKIIVEAILDLAQKSNIKTVAEFVDNEEVDKIITDLGINYGQGYYYSPPVDLLG